MTMVRTLTLATLAALRMPALALSTSAAPPRFPIGTPGEPWGATERSEWLLTRRVQRSYADEVVAKVDGLRERFDVVRYGELSVDAPRYPLYAVMSKDWAPEKPHVLVTGGVHGYEKSGVQGALLFLDRAAAAWSPEFNIIVAPCVSPWGYETIQRWNAQAIDPNRSFNPDGEVVPGRPFNPEPATEESSALLALLAGLGVDSWCAHIDLHETTDTDETEFRPAKAARDGVESKPGTIPDGFYLVSDSTNPRPKWHRAMIDAVREVTHIAEADEDGNLIGEETVQPGVIAIPSPRELGLCAGMTNAEFATTTEVYPDSPRSSEGQCNEAQVACIEAALRHISRGLAGGDPEL